MADFGPWLRNNTDNSPGLTALRVFADGQGGTWPYQSNAVDDYLAVINQANPNNAGDLRLALYRYYVIWLANSVASGPGRISLGSIALVVAGLVIATFLLFGVFTSSFLTSIADAAKARGLMTFLFAFATTSVVVVVTIGVLWVPKDEVEARFSKAKDIMTILISVLGTILGFYFGQAQNPNATAPQPAQMTTASTQPNAKPAVAGGAGPTSPSPATPQGEPTTPEAAPAPTQKSPAPTGSTTGQGAVATPDATTTTPTTKP
jgi:hypothetical protein